MSPPTCVASNISCHIQSSFHSFLNDYTKCQFAKVYLSNMKMHVKDSTKFTNSRRGMIGVVGNSIEPFANSIHYSKG